MATLCGGCGMDQWVTGLSTSKLSYYQLINSINLRTPGAHGNDITTSEQADAACPDEFSTWTMTCAEDSSVPSKFKYNLFSEHSFFQRRPHIGKIFFLRSHTLTF